MVRRQMHHWLPSLCLASGSATPLPFGKKANEPMVLCRVWNAHNFWACMQQPEPHSDARAHPSAVSWALSDTTLWEALFMREEAGSGGRQVWGALFMREEASSSSRQALLARYSWQLPCRCIGLFSWQFPCSASSAWSAGGFTAASSAPYT
jgi:hypothetical protein